ncbi:MAG: hypothetical protein ACI31S_01875 [Bacilli bacterium]
MKKPTVIGFIPKKVTTKKNEKKTDKPVAENNGDAENNQENTEE